MSEEDKGGTSEPAKSLNPDLGYQLLRLARKFPQQLVRQIKKVHILRIILITQ